ncbi:hypothetical protein Hanom_Chr05g00463851 [Helianthus anomalus]
MATKVYHNLVRFHFVDFSVSVDQVQTHAPEINSLLFTKPLWSHTSNITSRTMVHRANNCCNRWRLGVHCNRVIDICSNKHITIIFTEMRKQVIDIFSCLSIPAYIKV